MKTKIILLALVLTGLFSCSKDGGEGGKNIVHGYVMEQWYDTNQNFLGNHPALEKPVYIIYGSTASYSNRYDTHYDGSYYFEKLRKGQYTIFTYQECTNCSEGKEPVFLNFELDERKEETELDTIFVDKIVQ